MRTYLPLIIILALIQLSADAQILIESKPAHLQIYARKTDGADVIAESKKLTITVEGNRIKGVLPIHTLNSMDPDVQKVISLYGEDNVIFELQTQDQFVFGKSLEEKVTREGEIYLESVMSRKKFLMDFIVTQRRQSDRNTFLIKGLGTLSLKDDLDMEGTMLEDRFSYQFTFYMEEYLR
jgi:galactitol-specific phosphotransferase system IIB component